MEKKSLKSNRIKNKFTKEEDEMLKDLVAKHGTNDWKLISKLMVGRNSRQCKDRWVNFLDPKVNMSVWTKEEDNMLIQKVYEHGRKWKSFEKFFNNRTDINIKNRWQLLERKSQRMKKNQTKTFKEDKLIPIVPKISKYVKETTKEPENKVTAKQGLMPVQNEFFPVDELSFEYISNFFNE